MVQTFKRNNGIPLSIAKIILEIILTYCDEMLVRMFFQKFVQHTLA